MNIHTVKLGQTLDGIAAQYGIATERLTENNSIKNGVAEGRELLILTPTRTHRVKRGEDLSMLASRFGVRREELMMRNPSLAASRLTEGKELVIRYPEPTRGTIAVNAYFNKSASVEKLRQIIHYITYLTVSAYRLEKDGLRRLFDAKNAVRIGREGGKVVLMRVEDGTEGEFFTEEPRRSEYIDALIALAKSGGYSGITLSLGNLEGERSEVFCKFLIELRQKMIGSELILFTELNERTPSCISEVSDGSVLSFCKRAHRAAPSFGCSDAAVYKKLADEAESSKVFIGIDTFAHGDKSVIGLTELFSRWEDVKIVTDESALTSCAMLQGEEFKFCSLKNLKAKLDLVYELGYMGVSFDIMSIPREYLLLIYALFHPVHFYLPFSLPI